MVNLLAELGPLTVVLRKIPQFVTRKVWGLVKIAKARILNTKKQTSYSVQGLPPSPTLGPPSGSVEVGTADYTDARKESRQIKT